MSGSAEYPEPCPGLVTFSKTLHAEGACVTHGLHGANSNCAHWLKEKVDQRRTQSSGSRKTHFLVSFANMIINLTYLGNFQRSATLMSLMGTGQLNTNQSNQYRYRKNVMNAPSSLDVCHQLSRFPETMPRWLAAKYS